MLRCSTVQIQTQFTEYQYFVSILLRMIARSTKWIFTNDKARG
jgi:hypothetical protein